MDRHEAAAAQLRAAHQAVAALAVVHVPRVDSWLGPASDGARDALDELDRAVRTVRAEVEEWLREARRAAADA